MERKSLYFIVFVFLTIIGIAFLGFGFNILQQTANTEKWPTTNGIVVSSTVTTIEEKAVVQYTYTVNGVSYSSGRINHGAFIPIDFEDANEVVSRYPVGKNVNVYYNPEKPSEAVLEPWTTWIDYLPILFGLIPILFGIIFLFLTIKQGKGTKHLEIVLNKTVYGPGEKIQGTIFLKLKKPVQANSLKIFFIGERIDYQYPTGSKGVMSMHAKRFPFIREELLLDGDNEYHERSYTFEITIPEDILGKAKYWSEGTADAGKKTAPLGEKANELTQKTKQFIDRLQTIGMATTACNAFFYVEAVLDVHHGINIQNEVEIEIQ